MAVVDPGEDGYKCGLFNQAIYGDDMGWETEALYADSYKFSNFNVFGGRKK